WGDAIMQLLYGSEIDAAHEKKILFALMIAYGFYSINYVYGTLLTANRNIKPLIFTAIVGVIVSIIGCTIVAGKYGALGIAYICALTISVVTIINIWIAHRRLQLMIN